jgi:O-antigen/teichoic acid export membrane protein
VPDDDNAGGPPPAAATALPAVGAAETSVESSPRRSPKHAAPSAGSSPADDVGSRRGAFTGGIWSAASTVAPMVGTLALSVVISRRLGAAVLGEQSLVAYVSSLMVSVLIYSFTSASVQLLASAGGAKDQARMAWLARWSFAAHLAGGAAAAGVMVSAGLARSDYRELWILAAVTAMVDSVGWAYACRDIAQRGWARTSSRRLVAQAVSPVAAIVALLAGSGIQGVFIAQLCVSVLLLVALRRIDQRTLRPAARDHAAPPWRPALRLWSLFAVSGLITQIVERRLELLFLDHYHDARTVAMYSVAFSLVAIPITLSGSLIHAAMPAIASRHAQDPSVVTRALSRAARVVVTIDLFLAVGTVTVGPALVTSVYGRDFTEAGSLVRWLGLVLLVVPLGQLCTALWSGTGRLAPVLVAGGIGAVTDIVLALVLIPPLAAAGAVITTISAQTVAAAIIIGYTVRNGFRFDLRPRRLVRVVLILAVAGTLAATAEALVDGVPGAVLGVLGYLVLVGLGARLLGFFDTEDVEWLAGTVPGPAARVLRAFSPSR